MHWVSPLLVVLRYGRYSLCWGPIVALYIFSPSHLIFVFSFHGQNLPFLFIAIVCLFFHNQCLCFSLNSTAMILTKFVNTQVIELRALQGWKGKLFFRRAGGEGQGQKSIGRGRGLNLQGHYWKYLRIWPYFGPQPPHNFDHFCGAPLPTVRGGASIPSGFNPICPYRWTTCTPPMPPAPIPLVAYLHLSVHVRIKVCCKKTWLEFGKEFGFAREDRVKGNQT